MVLSYHFSPITEAQVQVTLLEYYATPSLNLRRCRYLGGKIENKSPTLQA